MAQNYESLSKECLRDADTLWRQAWDVPRLGQFLDPLRYTFLSFYPRWSVLPESRTDRLPQVESGKPFALYVHMPFCHGKCPGCLYVKQDVGQECLPQERWDGYLQALKKHLYLYGGETSETRESGKPPVQPVVNWDSLSCIYIGGGTPSLLTAEMIDDLFDMITKCTGRDARDLDEVSFECHPRSFQVSTRSEDRAKLTALLKWCGSKLRLSLGVQSLQPSLHRRIRGESSDIDENLESTLKWISEIDMQPKVNLDFMFGFDIGTTVAEGESQQERLLASVTEELTQLGGLLKRVPTSVQGVTFYQLWHGSDRPPSEFGRPDGSGDSRGGPLPDEGHARDPVGVLACRLLIDKALRSWGFSPEVQSLYVRDGSGVGCRYHVDHLYGSGDFIGVGPGAYCHVGGFSYMTLSDEKEYQDSVTSGHHPVGLGTHLGDGEREFRQAVLGLKRRPASPLSLCGMDDSVRSQVAKAMGHLEERKLATADGSPQKRTWTLNEDGFAIADEIAAWLSTLRPFSHRHLMGKARTADSYAKALLDSSIDLTGEALGKALEGCLAEATKQVDEYFRTGEFLPNGSATPQGGPQASPFPPAARYTHCVCALYSKLTERPVFAQLPYFPGWDRIGGTSRSTLAVADQYERTREYYNDMVSRRRASSSKTTSSRTSIFDLFFAPPDESAEPQSGSDGQMILLHTPPILRWKRSAPDSSHQGPEVRPYDIDISAMMDNLDAAIRVFDGDWCTDSTRYRGEYWGAFFKSLDDESKETFCRDRSRFLSDARHLRHGMLSGEVQSALVSEVGCLDGYLKDPKGEQPDLAASLVTFCLYWVLADRETPGATNWIVHVPYMTYDDHAQGGVIAFLRGGDRPTAGEYEILQRGATAIVSRISAREMALSLAHRETQELEQRARADLAVRMAEERRSVLRAFAHDAKSLPAVLSGFLSAPLPAEVRLHLSSIFSKEIEDHFSAFAALIPGGGGLPKRAHIASALRKECADRDGPPVSVATLCSQKVLLALMRTMVAGRGFRSLAKCLWHGSGLWQWSEEGEERLSPVFWNDKLDFLRSYERAMSIDMVLDFIRNSAPMMAVDVAPRLEQIALPARLKGRASHPEGTLYVGLSLLLSEIVTNIFRHNFGDVGIARDTLRRYRETGQGYRLSFDVDQHLDGERGQDAMAWDIVVRCTPGTKLREPLLAESKRGAGLATLLPVAHACGADFATIVEVGAEELPWCKVEQGKGGLADNEWRIKNIPWEGLTHA
jgi:coproporphyrinogen III oxidase-like Fe-S oxidoreductase